MEAKIYAAILVVALVAISAAALLGMPSTGNMTGNAIENKEADMGSTISYSDPFLGPEDAKVTVTVYSDFECPYCGAAEGTHEVLVQRFSSSDPSWEAPVPKLKNLAEEGKIKLVFKDFPLSVHKNAQKAAEAGQCAYEQGMFWEYHDILFENQEALDVASLKKYADNLELDTEQFNTCLDSGRYAEEVQKDFDEGAAAGVSGTPTFFINGRKIVGAQSFSSLEGVINEELGDAAGSSIAASGSGSCPFDYQCTEEQNCGLPECGAPSGGSCGC